MPACAFVPVEDVEPSTAEVLAIDAVFTAIANEFVFPPQLDFSTSRAASLTCITISEHPTPTAKTSVVPELSYSAQPAGTLLISSVERAACTARCGGEL